MVGCSFNEPAATVLPPFLQQTKPNFPVGYASRDAVFAYLSEPIMKNLYVPMMAFVDRRFQVRSQYTGENQFFRDEKVNIRNAVEALVKESSLRPAAKKSSKQ